MRKRFSFLRSMALEIRLARIKIASLFHAVVVAVVFCNRFDVWRLRQRLYRRYPWWHSPSWRRIQCSRMLHIAAFRVDLMNNPVKKNRYRWRNEFREFKYVYLKVSQTSEQPDSSTNRWNKWVFNGAQAQDQQKWWVVFQGILMAALNTYTFIWFWIS